MYVYIWYTYMYTYMSIITSTVCYGFVHHSFLRPLFFCPPSNIRCCFVSSCVLACFSNNICLIYLLVFVPFRFSCFFPFVCLFACLFVFHCMCFFPSSIRVSRHFSFVSQTYVIIYKQQQKTRKYSSNYSPKKYSHHIFAQYISIFCLALLLFTYINTHIYTQTYKTCVMFAQA